jgi:hypothetical protein
MEWQERDQGGGRADEGRPPHFLESACADRLVL